MIILLVLAIAGGIVCIICLTRKKTSKNTLKTTVHDFEYSNENDNREQRKPLNSNRRSYEDNDMQLGVANYGVIDANKYGGNTSYNDMNPGFSMGNHGNFMQGNDAADHYPWENQNYNPYQNNEGTGPGLNDSRNSPAKPLRNERNSPGKPLRDSNRPRQSQRGRSDSPQRNLNTTAYNHALGFDNFNVNALDQYLNHATQDFEMPNNNLKLPRNSDRYRSNSPMRKSLKKNKMQNERQSPEKQNESMRTSLKKNNTQNERKSSEKPNVRFGGTKSQFEKPTNFQSNFRNSEHNAQRNTGNNASQLFTFDNFNGLGGNSNANDNNNFAQLNYNPYQRDY